MYRVGVTNAADRGLDMYSLGEAPIMAGADGFEPPVAESESAALPLGEAPIMAGVDGVKPPSADLESAVLLTELNS